MRIGANPILDNVRRRLLIASAVAVALFALSFSLLLLVVILPNGTTYSDDGVTCALSASAPRYIDNLVPEITQTSKFQTLANGMPFIYAYTDNITNRVASVGGTTQNLPPLVELGFYSYGGATSCGDVGTVNATELILVQVPTLNSEFNMTGATYDLSAPHF